MTGGSCCVCGHVVVCWCVYFVGVLYALICFAVCCCVVCVVVLRVCCVVLRCIAYWCVVSCVLCCVEWYYIVL
jgi:hypothetical protein